MNFNNTKFIKSIGFYHDLSPSKKVEVAFCGRSNVGKSSLLNKLCNRKSLAKVGSTPGKTTTVNFFEVNDNVDLIDLPGYGYARRSEREKSRWAVLMEHYFNSERKIALTVLLLDIRHDPTENDFQMINFLMYNNIPFIIVLTKRDKLSNTASEERTEQFKQLLKPFRPVDILQFSVFDDKSIIPIRNIIIDTVGKIDD